MEDIPSVENVPSVEDIPKEEREEINNEIEAQSIIAEEYVLL